MSKSVISVTVYQKENTVYKSPITVGVPINSRTVISPVPHPGATSMVGENGEAADPTISEKVYACINVVTPSNAGSKAYFVSQTVADLISDINS